jgi:P4 family phage/plasmid primase-like protien
MTFTKYITDNFKSNTDKFQTHLSFVNGKFNVPDESIEKFNKMYYDAILKGEKMYLMEKIYKSTFAYFLDIDTPKNGKKITKEDLATILESNEIILKQHVKNADTSYILSKRNDKYHVNYYNIVLDNGGASSLSYLLTETLGEIKDCIDRSVYNTNLRMLGSCKKESENDSGDLTYKIYDLQTDTVKEYSDIDFLEFSKTFIRKTDKTLKNELIDIPVEAISQKSDLKIDKVLQTEIQKYLTDLKLNCKLLQNFNVSNIRSVKTIFNKISKSYNHYICIDEKYCPFKEREHIRDASPIYIELSSTGTFIKCHDQDCKSKRYPEKGLQGVDLNVVEYPNLYNSIHASYLPVELEIDDNLRAILQGSLSGTHYQIAKVVFTIYKDKFRVDSLKNPEWYMFDGIYWKKSWFFNILLSSEIPRYYKALLSGESEEEPDEDAITLTQLVRKIVLNLENAVFKRNIMDQCCMLFKNHDPKFMDKLDSNPYLLGFKNGVYDLKTRTFREGNREDYLTFSTGYDYTEYDPKCKEVQDIFSYLRKTIPNKLVLEFMLCILAKSLIGIPDEKFYIFTGLSGSNGKSKLMNLLEYTLGDFMKSVDSSLLTNKKGLSSNASPDIIRMKGVRMFSFSEPDNLPLQTNTIKSFSGGDTIIARELYRSPVSFKLQGTMFVCCNEVPKIENIEGGIMRRIRVIEFKSKFCENPKLGNVYEHKMDKNLDIKLKAWKPYFIGILLHYLQFKDDIKEPDEVRIATSSYLNDQDKFQEFFSECVVVDKKCFTSLKDIHNSFVDWYNESYKSEKTPSLSQFKTKIRLLYGNESIVKGKKGYNVHVLDLNDPNGNDDIFER